MSQQSFLQKKRQNFRKQIRRQHLDQKFRKIRVSLYSVYQTNIQEQKYKQQINQTIQHINQHNYYEQFNEGNYQSDSKSYTTVRQLFMLYEEQLAQPTQEVYALLQQQPIQAQILQRWEAMYKWEQQIGEQVQKIVKTIANTLCSHSYNEVVADFLLRTVDFLIYGNKVMLMKRIAFKEDEKMYFVGGPEKHYNSSLRLVCKNILMNFTAPNDDQLLLPFITDISEVIKQSSYFAHAYHNIFLTQDIPLAQKLHMYSDFLNLIQKNPNILHDGDISYPAIFYIILTNRPLVTKIGVKAPYNSIELNYRCLLILNRYIGQAKLVIDSYSSSPHSEEYHNVVMNIAYGLEALCREEEWVINKVPEMDNVIDFMISRIKTGKELSEIKCTRIVLHSLVRLSRFNTIYSQMCSRKVLLSIEIQRLFDRLWKQLFSQTLSNKSCLQQKTQQIFQNSFTQQLPFQHNQSFLNSQYAELQIDCLTQIIKIYKFETDTNVKPWNYLQQHIFEKMMVVCNEWRVITSGSVNFRVIKDECLEFLCQCLVQLLRCSPEQVQEKSSYRTQDILLGEFLFTSFQYYSNLFALFAVQIDEIIQNPQASGILIVEIILPTINELLHHLLKKMQFTVQQYGYERSTFSQQKWQDFIQKDRWVIIYHEYSQVHEIQKRLEQLFNSNHKSIDNNQNSIDIINEILKMTDHIEELIMSSGGQKFPIQLQK